jgi:type I restriction enzyme S subunit
VGEFLNRSSRYLTSKKARELQCTMLQTGDLLIARMPDPLGRACLFPGVGQPSVTAVDVFIWRPGKNAADTRWLMHAINSPQVREHLQNIAGGTTRQRVSGGNLKRLALPTPSKTMQIRIAAKTDGLLSRSKSARDELGRVPMLVERYKEAVLAAGFCGDLTADWRELNHMHCPVITKRTPVDNRIRQLGELPDSWSWRAVGDIATVRGGLTKNPSRRSLPIKMFYLRVANVYANELRLDRVDEIGVTPAEASRVRLKNGDLLIVEGNGSIGQIGRVALWQDELIDCGHQNHIIRATPLPEISSKFVLYWLLSPAGREAIEVVASSSSGLHTLSLSKVSGLPVPVCAEVEMGEVVEQIERRLAALEATVRQFSRSTELLDRLDQAILAKALRGGPFAKHLTEQPKRESLEVMLPKGAQAGKQNRVSL